MFHSPHWNSALNYFLGKCLHWFPVHSSPCMQGHHVSGLFTARASCQVYSHGIQYIKFWPAHSSCQSEHWSKFDSYNLCCEPNQLSNRYGVRQAVHSHELGRPQSGRFPAMNEVWVLLTEPRWPTNLGWFNALNQIQCKLLPNTVTEWWSVLTVKT